MVSFLLTHILSAQQRVGLQDGPGIDVVPGGLGLLQRPDLGLELRVLRLEVLDLVLVVGDLPLHVGDVLPGLLEHLGPAGLVTTQCWNAIL